MKIIKRELYRHFHFVRVAEDIVYSNPKHIKGVVCAFGRRWPRSFVR